MFFLFGIIGLLIAILWKPFPNWLTVAIAAFAFLAQVVITGPVPAVEHSIGSYIAHIVLGVWTGSIVRLVFPKK